MDALDVLYSIIGEDGFEPRYNISPSEPPLPAGSRRASPRRITRVPIVLQRGDEFVGEDAIWPLIPVWARGEVPKYSTANARSEEMADKNAYRNAWKREQRCLIYATGFYEWQARPGLRTKQPWHIRLKGQGRVRVRRTVGEFTRERRHGGPVLHDRDAARQRTDARDSQRRPQPAPHAIDTSA